MVQEDREDRRRTERRKAVGTGQRGGEKDRDSTYMHSSSSVLGYVSNFTPVVSSSSSMSDRSMTSVGSMLTE